MFLSDIFYWQSKNHSILKTMKAELLKFSDSSVEIFHSLLQYRKASYGKPNNKGRTVY